MNADDLAEIDILIQVYLPMMLPGLRRNADTDSRCTTPVYRDTLQ
jgi:hypothetical protein